MDSNTNKSNLTFENYAENENNRFAYIAAKSIAFSPISKINDDSNFNIYNPLYIYGESHLGKTHLLNAIYNEIKKRFPDLNVLYVTAEQFANDFICASQSKTLDAFRKKYRENIDVFLVDDIQFISQKPTVEEEFFYTFNLLISNGKQIVITSDRHPKYISLISEELKSLLENGLLADIKHYENM